MGCIKIVPSVRVSTRSLRMKKILAAIVEYKLNKKKFSNFTHQLSMELVISSDSYPPSFAKKMHELLTDIQDINSQNILPAHKEELLMDILEEMELLLVDYLTNVSYPQTNHCFSC